MATTIADKQDDPKPPDASKSPKPSEKVGFFSLYKPGQGYWTRLGTALGASVIALFAAWFLYDRLLPSIFGSGMPVLLRLGICAAVVASAALLTWWLMNHHNRAQFLIDTDNELKKVNWSTWRELRGSTVVVVFFMVIIAITLFVFDVQFHGFFHFIQVFTPDVDIVGLHITGMILSGVLTAIGYASVRGRERRQTGFNWPLTLVIAGGLGVLVWAGSLAWQVATGFGATAAQAATAAGA